MSPTARAYAAFAAYLDGVPELRAARWLYLTATTLEVRYARARWLDAVAADPEAVRLYAEWTRARSALAKCRAPSAMARTA